MRVARCMFMIATDIEESERQGLRELKDKNSG
jgi:hypothetical protein